MASQGLECCRRNSLPRGCAAHCSPAVSAPTWSHWIDHSTVQGWGQVRTVHIQQARTSDRLLLACRVTWSFPGVWSHVGKGQVSSLSPSLSPGVLPFLPQARCFCSLKSSSVESDVLASFSHSFSSSPQKLFLILLDSLSHLDQKKKNLVFFQFFFLLNLDPYFFFFFSWSLRFLAGIIFWSSLGRWVSSPHGGIVEREASLGWKGKEGWGWNCSKAWFMLYNMVCYTFPYFILIYFALSCFTWFHFILECGWG